MIGRPESDRLLLQLAKDGGGDPQKARDAKSVGAAAGLDPDASRIAAEQLDQRGLVCLERRFGVPFIAITAAGVAEVAQLIQPAPPKDLVQEMLTVARTNRLVAWIIIGSWVLFPLAGFAYYLVSTLVLLGLIGGGK